MSQAFDAAVVTASTPCREANVQRDGLAPAPATTLPRRSSACSRFWHPTRFEHRGAVQCSYQRVRWGSGAAGEPADSVRWVVWVWVPVPGPRHWTLLADLVRRHHLQGNLISDAHLAALAQEHGLTLVSADSEFARFSGLTWINPLA